MDLPNALPGLDSVLPGRLGASTNGDAVLGRTGILPTRIESPDDGTGGTAVFGRRSSWLGLRTCLGTR